MLGSRLNTNVTEVESITVANRALGTLCRVSVPIATKTTQVGNTAEIFAAIVFAAEPTNLQVVVDINACKAPAPVSNQIKGVQLVMELVFLRVGLMLRAEHSRGVWTVARISELCRKEGDPSTRVVLTFNGACTA